MKLAAYVITLERIAERKRHVERIIAQCPWECQIAPAVDGAKLTSAEGDAAYQRFLHRPRYHMPLGLGEIGCFLSHRKLWQRIVDEQLDAALILEDDINLQLPEFAASLEFARKNIQPGDYLQFQVRNVGSNHPVTVVDGQHSIVQPRVTPLRTTAQLVSRLAAERLLAVSRPFDRQVDAFLQMTWLTNVAMKLVLPKCVSEISQQIGGTLLGSGKKPLLTRLRRELLRPLYRSQIAILSHWNYRRAA